MPRTSALSPNANGKPSLDQQRLPSRGPQQEQRLFLGNLRSLSPDHLGVVPASQTLQTLTHPRSDKLAETRLMQQLRKRSAGTGVGALAMGGGGPGIGPASREGSVEPGSEGGEGAGTVVMDAYVKAKSIAVQMDEDAHM